MVDRIDRDQGRFREIVRGRIRQNLKQYISHSELIGRKGKELVSIPVPYLDIPHFRYRKNGTGGVGQGDGQVGQPIAPGSTDPAGGPAGSDPAEHILEVDITIDELAALLGEALALPRVEPKGHAQLHRDKLRYSSIRRAGPESLRHFKRTYITALRRQLAEGSYDPLRPCVVPLREDRRYRAWRPVDEPQANAVIIYIMDVSGSMGDDQKQIVRTCAFWIDTWLRSQYRGLERRYIIHDAAAKVVDEHTFYHTRESGGTRISSAYRTAHDLIQQHFPVEGWNIYFFQFSDGDNWGDDSRQAVQLLKESLLPKANLFCYGQVHSPYGSGEFLRVLRGVAVGDWQEKLVLAEIHDREAISDAIRLFLGTGR